MTQAPDEPEPSGRLRPTTPGGVAAWGIVGLVGGWLFHRAAGHVPVVTWAEPLALLLVAAILGATAYATRRSVRQAERRMTAHQFVNRLVLARACGYVGALVAGGYLGYAVSWLGLDADLARTRALHSAAAGVGGVLVVVTALVLERACRVPNSQDEP
ncbi:MAG: DUF3180 domain-containing protein [Nocardioides sp.]